MTAPPTPDQFAIALDLLRVGTCARVLSIDWESLAEPEARRLRQFGFDEGVAVQPLHLGPLGGDPLAIRVGRMTVAIRRNHAHAVQVVPLASTD